MFDSKYFGKRIRNLREHKKLSIENLSRELNLSETYLGKLERGERIPSIDVALTIANYWGISLCNYQVSNIENTNDIIQNLYKNLDIVNSKGAYSFLYEVLLELITITNGSDSNI